MGAIAFAGAGAAFAAAVAFAFAFAGAFSVAVVAGMNVAFFAAAMAAGPTRTVTGSELD